MDDEVRDWTRPILTLGDQLSQPMRRDSNPSLLPWEAVSYRLRYGTGETYAVAHATQMGDGSWEAFCAGPGSSVMAEVNRPTAEAARAAVEEHYFKEVESS